MNWKVWTSFLAAVAVTATLGVLVFFSNQGQTIERPLGHVTSIHVDLEMPYEGEATITYSAEAVTEEDFSVVVSAQRTILEFLPQYYSPYRDPNDVRVRRRGGKVSMKFPLKARERLELLFPEASLMGTWRPHWETLHFTVELPAGYEVIATEQEGLEDDMEVEAGGRWTVTGEERSAGWADFTVHYVRTEHVANGESGG